MNILFVHGLESNLSDEKRLILENYGKVFSPELDYKTNKNCFQVLSGFIENSEIDVLIGSSMGGFMGYYLSVAFNKPALLFNPALPYRSFEQEINQIQNPGNPFRYIVLGKSDNVVKYADNISYLNKNISQDENVEIKIINRLEHRIPVEIFEKEVFNFFRYFDMKSLLI